MEGMAKKWFRWMQRWRQLARWDHFVDAIRKRFVPIKKETKVTKLEEDVNLQTKALDSLKSTINGQQFKQLKVLKAQATQISQANGEDIYGSGQIGESSEFRTKQDEACMQVHQVFDELPKAIDTEIVDHIVQDTKGDGIQNDATTMQGNSNQILSMGDIIKEEDVTMFEEASDDEIMVQKSHQLLDKLPTTIDIEANKQPSKEWVLQQDDSSIYGCFEEMPPFLVVVHKSIIKLQKQREIFEIVKITIVSNFDSSIKLVSNFAPLDCLDRWLKKGFIETQLVKEDDPLLFRLLVMAKSINQAQAAIWSNGGNNTSICEGVEASVSYICFKAAASELKSVLEDIKSRASRKEYVHILSECHKLYYEQRLSLIKGTVHLRIYEFAKKEGLPSFTRSGCVYLMQVCQLEHQLFDHFFPSSSEDVSSLAPLIDPLSTLLYDTLRPRLIQETNVDCLCELVDILKVEFLGDQLSRKTESLAGLRPTLEVILADIHECMTFCARTHIRGEIENYIPFDEDLNYPAKLQNSEDVKIETTSADTNPFVFKTWYPLGARARVGFTGLTVAEHFRDAEGQDVLLVIDNIFRFTQANSEVTALLGRIPSAVGYQLTFATDFGGLQERITTNKKGSITSVQAIHVPVDDLTDTAPATTFAHWDATRGDHHACYRWKVRVCREKATGHAYDMKKLKKSEMLRSGQVECVKAERNLVAEVDRNCIVKLYCLFQDEEYPYFIMEYLPGGEMMALLMLKDIPTEGEVRFLSNLLTFTRVYVWSQKYPSMHMSFGDVFFYKELKEDKEQEDDEDHAADFCMGALGAYQWSAHIDCNHSTNMVQSSISGALQIRMTKLLLVQWNEFNKSRVT